MIYNPDLKDVPMTIAGVGAGMPTRWVWSEYGQFLNVYGIRNGVSMTFNTKSASDMDAKLDKLQDMRDKGLINDDDLQELEERLRTLSDFVAGGAGRSYTTAAIQDVDMSKTEPPKVDMQDEDIKELGEEAKPTTSQKQIDHLDRVRPLSHTPEAEAKRRKTIASKKEEKELGL